MAMVDVDNSPSVGFNALYFKVKYGSHNTHRDTEFIYGLHRGEKIYFKRLVFYFRVFNTPNMP